MAEEAVAEIICRRARQSEEAVEKAMVSPFDPDFLIVLCLAIAFDALDIVLELTGILVIPKLLGMGIDVITFAGFGAWVHIRTKRIVQTREQQKQALQKKMAQQQTKMQQQLAKSVAKGPARKTLTRMAITLIGELIPFVGLVPFWTITIIATLREKANDAIA